MTEGVVHLDGKGVSESLGGCLCSFHVYQTGA